jgi:hypothetical protein
VTIIRVTAYWRTTHEIETDDENLVHAPLMEWPEEILDEINASTAELYDWEIR